LDAHRLEHRSLWTEFQGVEDEHVDQGTVSLSMRHFRRKLQKMEEEFNKVVANAKGVLDASEELWMTRDKK